MNSHLDKEIFSETGCVNKDVLLRYRDAKLSDSQKHEVEKHLVDCPLCTEAVEGFALLSGTASFDEVNDRLVQLTQTSKTFTFNRYIAVAASVVAVTLLTWFAFQQMNDVPAERLAAIESVSDEDTIIEVPPSSESDVVQQSELQHFPQKKSVSAAGNREVHLENLTTQATQRQSVGNEIATAEVSSEFEMNGGSSSEIAAAAAVTPQSDARDEGDNVTLPESPAAVGYTSNVFTYVDNLKVINYEDFSKDKETVSKQDKSTSSKYENRAKKAEEEKIEVQSGMSINRKTTYTQILEGPLKLYNEGSYSSAIKGFDEVLVIHPGDENARFYKGMSLYHLKNYNAALNLLLPISKLNTEPFSPEALFYVAKSYVALGDKEKAITIFRSIVASKGFYADKAKGELRKLQ